MKVSTFTDTMIKKLKPDEKKYIRSEGNGFTIRVMPSGVKTWLYVYAIDDKRREMNLGSYPDVTLETARGKFEEAKKKVKNSIDPMAEKEQATQERRNAPTIKDLCDDYIKRYAKKFKRSWAKDEQVLNRDVIPAWGKRKAKEISKRDVNLLMETIIERGSPIMANYVYAVTRKMFNWAIEQDILETTPFLGTKLPSLKNERKRTLTESEILSFWKSLDRTDLNMSDNVRRCLKLILLTGQRPNEVGGMHTDEINGRWWTIPVARQKVSKKMEGKREPHKVYLTDTAIELIGNLKRIDKDSGEEVDRGFIFPTPIKKYDAPLGETALAVAVGRNLAAPLKDKKGKPLFDKEGKPATENLLGIEHFTPHDLRRTCATGMGGLRIMDEVIDAVLCHVKQGIIGVYNRHGYEKEKQQALEAWERKLNSIITGKECKVISIISANKAA
jgi:integrase